MDEKQWMNDILGPSSCGIRVCGEELGSSSSSCVSERRSELSTAHHRRHRFRVWRSIRSSAFTTAESHHVAELEHSRRPANRPRCPFSEWCVPELSIPLTLHLGFRHFLSAFPRRALPVNLREVLRFRHGAIGSD